MSRGAAIRQRYAAFGRALSACDGDPALELGVQVRAVLEGNHPSLARRDAAELVKAARERALSRGVEPKLVDGITTDPEHARYAASRIEALRSLPLSARSDGWIRVWCAFIPRILLLSQPVLGSTAYKRTYSAVELHTVAHWRVSAECEQPHLWSALAYWSGGLYREYTRRFGKEHACRVRASWLRVMAEEIVAAKAA